MSVLMPLSRVAKGGNFYFNSLSPFLLIICITSCIWELMSPHSDMTIPLHPALSYHILNLHNNTHPIPMNISWHQSYSTHHPDHMTLHPMQPLPHLQH